MGLGKTPLCWICNKEPATTSEHRSKRSDIKEQLGSSGPLYFHTDARRNLKLQSSNAKRLKFEPSICNSCNSARTQPHDFAWKRLSGALRNRHPPLKTGDIIRANRVFCHATSDEMLNVHLFFVKWLGCEIVESSIPIAPSIETLSQAIMSGRPHPNVWLAFGVAQRGKDWVGASVVDAASFNGGTGYDYLCRLYEVGALSVRVRLSSLKLKDDWHPTFTNRFVIANLVSE
ncbi:hypothetical protein EDE12_104117 [Methylosinus sp. sav-2]|uniref:hypothetical protein n=1 Tax=Methylosinus sp. sav-2 TaxID=2485168 RepID=UPI001066E16B|nr:hypothetical protein [Methylosinus sp. sav-2]TDX64827.1 hypothetical protein EDE12_104117 [Methylosinus sp. sav-2]